MKALIMMFQLRGTDYKYRFFSKIFRIFISYENISNTSTRYDN
jgi:hypothetical protein